MAVQQKNNEIVKEMCSASKSNGEVRFIYFQFTEIESI